MSDTSLDRANAIAKTLPADFTEDDAIALFAVFSLRYGWAGGFYTRTDARNEWEMQAEWAEWESDEPAVFDDAAWDRVKATAWWRKVLGGVNEDDLDALTEAVREAMAED